MLLFQIEEDEMYSKKVCIKCKEAMEETIRAEVQFKAKVKALKAIFDAGHKNRADAIKNLNEARGSFSPFFYDMYICECQDIWLLVISHLFINLSFLRLKNASSAILQILTHQELMCPQV